MRFIPVAVLLDLVCVLAFVVIGRMNHGEGLTPSGVALTAWPFLVSLAVGWVATLPWRPWRDPKVVVSCGWLVWLVAGGGALQLRAATGNEAEFSFGLVTMAFLGAAMLGWRGIAALLLRRRRTHEHAAAE